ncbi:hypothetical protein BDZ45DRAFT_801518 [Acephala macrosclerotiorum]|nr:hypothetical protein BDZ45DRAFT_801518 [Acephala macrosclerotiorum]
MSHCHPSMLSTAAKLIVSIDTGSTAFTVAFRRNNETVTQIVTNRPGHDPQSRDKSGSAPPTVLYYPKDRQPSWQRQVEMEEITSDDFDPRRKVVNFKSGLDKKSDSYRGLNSIAQYIGMKIEGFALTFTVLLLRYLFFDDLSFFREDMQAGLRIEDVILIFAKPPAWDVATYDSFRLAAMSLGFKNEQLRFISETEALVRAFFAENTRDSRVAKALKDVDSYVVVDFNKETPSETRIKPAGPLPLSENYGSETTVLKFQQFLKIELDRTGEYGAEEIEEICRVAGRAFRSTQSLVDLNDLSRFYHLRVAGIRANSKSGPLMIWAKDRLAINTAIFKNFYDESIDAIIDQVEKLIKLCGKIPSVLLIGGGYAMLPYLQTRFIDHFKNFDANIICHFPDHPKPMVARGGVDMCLNPRLTFSRLLKHSYSIKTEYTYTKILQDRRPEADFRQKEDKNEGCWNYIGYEWLGKLGREVARDQQLTVDANGMRKRRFKSWDDLTWTETIEIWNLDPGADECTLPSDARLEAGAAERILISVDLTKYFTKPSDVPKERIKDGWYFMKYKIFLQLLNGERAEYWLQFCKPGEKTLSSIPLLECPMDLTTLYELGTCPRRSAADESAAHASTMSLNSCSDAREDNAETMTASEQLTTDLAKENANLPKSQQQLDDSLTASQQFRTETQGRCEEVDLVASKIARNNATLLEKMADIHNSSLFDPSPSHPGLKAAPRRRLMSHTLVGTPTVPRPNNLSDIGLSVLNCECITEALAPKPANKKIIPPILKGKLKRLENRPVFGTAQVSRVVVDTEIKPTESSGRVLRSKIPTVAKADDEISKNVRFAFR